MTERAAGGRLGGLARRLMAPFREFGFGAGSVYLLDRLLQTVSPKLRLLMYDLVVQPVASEPRLPETVLSTFVLQPIERSDPALHFFPVPPAIIESRFDQGAKCIGAFKDDKLQGYMWFMLGPYEEDEIRCTYLIPAGGRSAFDFDIYVFPPYRMGRTFVALWDGADTILRNLGVEWTFSRIARFNSASRSAHKRLGARRIGRVFAFQVWGMQVTFATVAPYFGVTIAPPERVRLRLSLGGVDR